MHYNRVTLLLVHYHRNENNETFPFLFSFCIHVHYSYSLFPLEILPYLFINKLCFMSKKNAIQQHMKPECVIISSGFVFVFPTFFLKSFKASNNIVVISLGIICLEKKS